MPRNKQEVRRRLQLAALELYRKHGYEQTTAAEIAAKAGVTERTFFRHFADKREVLFYGEEAFATALTNAVRDAPASCGIWETLFRAFQSVEHMFVENRAFTEPRRHVIASNPALQERQSAKARSLIGALASALCARGIPNHRANLAAQMGMAALSHAVAAWLDDDSVDLSEHIASSFREVGDLTSPDLKTDRKRQLSK
jgi:AcrR family transcriptional regulator